jgi:hypothetical protein
MVIETDLEGQNIIVDHNTHEATNIDDLHFMKLTAESPIPLFESSQLTITKCGCSSLVLVH